MARQLTLLPVFFLLAVVAPTTPVRAADHVVGGFIWSIPPSSDLYSAWASNRTFLVGDNLVFRFEMGLCNVVQVSRREYEDCTADDPYQTFDSAPTVVVPLDAAGVRYFICTVGNYCALGVKLHVTTQNPS
ncbi:hypothetical protein GUJ93_ZPchr0003g16865 [Zizania palustris]|uniref:Phytocyanin domain-containing protein n=1 Tax=Zizania palustris TaxID=103762 RepID=A0A8J5SLY5_ZIZPA|nr:hypothetical protein GUJ93_ZPchr0003g16865 [Zizania palustris]